MNINTTAACNIPIGAHLSTPRRGFTHHGIYVGDGRVVHYPGMNRPFDTGPVVEVDLFEFACGRGWRIEETPCLFDADEVVRRARGRIGEDAYRVRDNNCEHFCHWCRTGRSRSTQVETFTQPIARMLGWMVGTIPARIRPSVVMTVVDYE